MKNSKYHHAVYLLSLFAGAALILTGCGGSGGDRAGLSPSSDTTAPTVSSTVPTNTATGFAVNSAITATFSEAMKVATITGHKTLQMLKRYTHLRAEDLALKLG